MADLSSTGVALGARFRVRQRRGEEGPPFREWFATHGFRVVAPIATQEGEGGT